MGRTVSKIVSLEDFKALVAYHWSKHQDFGRYFEGEPKKGMKPEKFLKATSFRGGKDLTPKVFEDLSKVQFDTENIEWENGKGYKGFKGIVGFRQLANGMPLLGACAGGDWESPLFFLIYWSGTELRGYIPTDGNTWNTDTKTAYGSAQDVIDGDEDAVEKAENDNAKKRFGVGAYQNAEPDAEAIIEDIQKRIVIGTGNSITPKGMNDIDWDIIEKFKEKEEAEDERGLMAKQNCDKQGFPDSGCVQLEDSPPVIKPSDKIVIPLDPKSVMADLDEVERLARELLFEVGSFRECVRSGNPGAKCKAVGVREVSLRELVTKLVKVTLAVEHME